MAITGNDRGTGSNGSSQSATVMSPTSTIAAGSSGYLCIAADNAATANNTNFPTPVVDSVGNTWIARVDAPSAAAAGANLERVMYTCEPLTTALTSSDNVTITYTVANVTSKVWVFVDAVPATSGNICMSRGPTNSAVQANGSGATVTEASTSLNGDMVLGMAGAESADLYVGDADTLGGSWSTKQSIGTGTGATGMSLCVQYKIVNASSSQVYNPTFSSGTSDNGVAIILISELPPKTRIMAAFGSSEATTTVTFQRGLAAGSIGVLCWAGKNNGSGGASSNLPATLTDTKSNTWTLNGGTGGVQNGIYDPGVAGVGVELGTYTATISTPLVSLVDTVGITYTFANATSKSVVVFEFSDATGYTTGAVGTGNGTTSNTVTTTSITTPHYVIGLGGAQGTNTWTGDSDTSNGSWSTPVINEAGTSTLIAQYKRVTGSGTQTFNYALTANNNMIQWTELTVPAPATGNTGAFFQFF